MTHGSDADVGYSGEGTAAEVELDIHLPFVPPTHIYSLFIKDEVLLEQKH